MVLAVGGEKYTLKCIQSILYNEELLSSGGKKNFNSTLSHKGIR